MTKKIISVVCVALFVAALATGCNTVRGAGKDIERGGQAIQESTE